jgi:Predicted pyridoxal phosphate-dependent enzyme apparently involved in regulation of cell wall biogenesis
MFTSRSKRNVRDLAILGGKAAFKQQLYVGRPNIGNRERLLDRINDILDRRWLTNQGPFVCEFETRISEILGVKHCIATCNATIGLAIAIRALGMTGEVIIPSFTFVATAHALQWQQVSPVFGDIDERSHNLDPRRVESLITPRTTGILATHLWGRPCAIDELTQIASRHGLKLAFDAAHAFGSSYQGKMIGNFGQAEVFSFHATKFLNTFEGGAIVTNDDDLAEKIRLMTNYGFAGYDRVIHLGINGKMSEIAAAMGLTGLESMAEFIVINRDHYKRYLRALKDIPGIEMIRYDEDERNNYQYIVLEIDETKTHISRDLITSALHAENVLARRYFYPGCHRMEPYRSYSPHAGLLLSATEQLSERVLSLPTGTTVDANDIDLICDLIRFLVAQGAVISEQVSASTADHP